MISELKEHFKSTTCWALKLKIRLIFTFLINKLRYEILNGADNTTFLALASIFCGPDYKPFHMHGLCCSLLSDQDQN